MLAHVFDVGALTSLTDHVAFAGGDLARIGCDLRPLLSNLVIERARGLIAGQIQSGRDLCLGLLMGGRVAGRWVRGSGRGPGPEAEPYGLGSWFRSGWRCGIFILF